MGAVRGGRTRRQLGALCAALALVCALAAASARAAEPTVPVPWMSPGVDPRGANDFSCRPPATHPYPVVLVHGTFYDKTDSWNEMSPALAGAGYCVFAVDLPARATVPSEQSARALADFVKRVLAATGARRVALVGHSQGGVVARYYARFLGGASRVAQIIGMGAPDHGTASPLAPATAPLNCPACSELEVGSPLFARLNAGRETLPGIGYTEIATSHDEVSTPYYTAFLRGADVTNVLLQATCALDPVEHLGLPYDPIVLQWVENALASGDRAQPGFKPSC